MTATEERLLQSYCNARLSWEAWCYLSNINLSSRNDFLNKYVNNNPLLFHLRYLAIKDTHIELYKILRESQNNEDNIFSLLKKRKSIKPNTEIEVVNILAELEQHREIINRINNYRDKFYAHLDANFEEQIKNSNITGFFECWKTIEKAIIELTSKEILEERLSKISSRNDFELIIDKSSA